MYRSIHGQPVSIAVCSCCCCCALSVSALVCIVSHICTQADILHAVLWLSPSQSMWLDRCRYSHRISMEGPCACEVHLLFCLPPLSSHADRCTGICQLVSLQLLLLSCAAVRCVLMSLLC